MPDPKNGIRLREKSGPVVPQNGIAYHDCGVAAAPFLEFTPTPTLELLENSLSTIMTSSNGAVVNVPPTLIPLRLLLFAVTLLSMPVTTAEPAGPTTIPLLELLEAIVFDTEKLLDVMGAISIPLFPKFRDDAVLDFEVSARLPIPFVTRCQVHRW